MADQRLQRLRRDGETADPDAKVRLLRERMRAGALSEEQVRLAARLGDPSSQIVVGEDLSGADLWQFVDPLGRFAYLRVTQGIGAAVLHHFRDHPEVLIHLRSTLGLLREVIACSQCPCLEHRRAAEDLHQPEPVVGSSLMRNQAGWVSLSLSRAVRGLLVRRRRLRKPFQQLCMMALLHVGEEQLDASLRTELVPWVLSLRP